MGSHAAQAIRHSKPIVTAITTEGFGFVLALLVTPAIVYFVTYIPWFLHFGWDLQRWAEMQGKGRAVPCGPEGGERSGAAVARLLRAGVEVDPPRPTHVLLRGVRPEGVRQVIYAQGNPAIFWGSLLAIPYVAYAWWRTRDWRAGFVTVTIAGLYLPWFLVSRPQFFFYATPLTPFFVLACVYALRDLSELHVAGSRSRPFLLSSSASSPHR